MIKVIISWILGFFTPNPELVHLHADEWLAIHDQLLPKRESLGVELLAIIKKEHFRLIGERVADMDGGSAVYGIIIPAHLHSHLNELRNN